MSDEYDVFEVPEKPAKRAPAPKSERDELAEEAEAIGLTRAELLKAREDYQRAWPLG